MTTVPDNPSLDYDTLLASLAQAGVVVAPAELHGGVCGALCVGGARAAERWLAECLEDQNVALDAFDSPRVLGDVVSASWRMLTDRDLAFEPLLPGDHAPLEEQVQAIALWCHGFLGVVGLAVRGAGGEDREIAEILADFAEISRAGLSEEEAAGEGQPDFALAEIHEYVRVGVQIVFEDLTGRRTAAPSLH
jgi:uncharacterized protein YgfB (UPF0149 family)